MQTSEVRPVVHDVLTAARATWGVASSPPMPRWREYMAWIDARRSEYRSARPAGPGRSARSARTGGAGGRADFSTVFETERRNAGEIALERALIALAVRAPREPPHDALPWSAQPCSPRVPPSRRLYSALVSFVDDYAGPYPEELFPRDEVHALRLALRDRGCVLTIDEQLEAALEHTGGRTFAAAILLHAVTRLVARDRDARAVGSLPWEERLRDARWIAPFAPSIAPDGDPPGDTYHYWANFAVGLHAALHARVVPRALGAAFFFGPVAMKWIREGVFGSQLFAGTHSACDRMGLRHGHAVGRALLARSR